MPKVFGNTGEFENPPGGNHPAIILGFHDIGTQPGYEGRPTHQLVALFELMCLSEDGTSEVRMTKGPMAGKRFLISKTYTFSLAETANLSIDLTNFRGREFTADERSGGFELDTLKGKPCSLNVVEYVKRDGKPGVKVSTIGPAIRGLRMVKETPDSYVPDWITKKAAEGLNRTVQSGTGAADGDDGIPF